MVNNASTLASLKLFGVLRQYPIENWAQELDRSRNPEDVARWTRVFQDHREFFITYHLQGDKTLKAALRLRYVFKTYNSQTGKEYTPIEIERLPKEEKDRLTTKPLQAEQLQTLLNTAIELHDRTIEQSKESKRRDTVVQSSKSIER